MRIGIHVNMCYSSQILVKLEYSPQSFEKSSSIHLSENESSGSRVFLCRRTDGGVDIRTHITF